MCRRPCVASASPVRHHHHHHLIATPFIPPPPKSKTLTTAAAELDLVPLEVLLVLEHLHERLWVVGVVDGDGVGMGDESRVDWGGVRPSKRAHTAAGAALASQRASQPAIYACRQSGTLTMIPSCGQVDLCVCCVWWRVCVSDGSRSVNQSVNAAAGRTTTLAAAAAGWLSWLTIADDGRRRGGVRLNRSTIHPQDPKPTARSVQGGNRGVVLRPINRSDWGRHGRDERAARSHW